MTKKDSFGLVIEKQKSLVFMCNNNNIILEYKKLGRKVKMI